MINPYFIFEYYNFIFFSINKRTKNKNFKCFGKTKKDMEIEENSKKENK